MTLCMNHGWHVVDMLALSVVDLVMEDSAASGSRPYLGGIQPDCAFYYTFLPHLPCLVDKCSNLSATRSS